MIDSEKTPPSSAHGQMEFQSTPRHKSIKKSSEYRPSSREILADSKPEIRDSFKLAKIAPRSQAPFPVLAPIRSDPTDPKRLAALETQVSDIHNKFDSKFAMLLGKVDELVSLAKNDSGASTVTEGNSDLGAIMEDSQFDELISNDTYGPEMATMTPIQEEREQSPEHTVPF